MGFVAGTILVFITNAVYCTIGMRFLFAKTTLWTMPITECALFMYERIVNRVTDIRAITVPKAAVFGSVPIGSIFLTVQFFRMAWERFAEKEIVPVAKEVDKEPDPKTSFQRELVKKANKLVFGKILIPKIYRGYGGNLLDYSILTWPGQNQTGKSNIQKFETF